jgi:hypothetical protein
MINTEFRSMEGMEDAQKDYNHEDEIKGMYVCMGKEGTKSNGHG